jgi:lipopolysaccharide transport system permease protein
MRLLNKWNIDHFAVYLLTGNILFGFMSGSVTRAIFSVSGSAALLKKTYLPKYIFTLSAVTSELVNFLFSLAALVIVMAATRVPVSWHAALIIVPIVELYIFSLGLGLILAQLGVFFQDTQYLWGVFSALWMYLTPIFYPVGLLPEPLRGLVERFNPMFAYIDQFRSLTIGHNPIHGWGMLIGLAWAAGFLAIGLLTFSRTKRKFILYM